MKRYLPIFAIAAVFLLAVGVVITSGGDDKPAQAENSAPKADQAAAKETAPKETVPAERSEPTPPTAKVTGPHNDPVPILMYHVTKASPAGTPYPDLWVTPADFKGQMNWLADNGYTGITMKQLFDYWDDGYALPKKPVVISFDDGYPSHDKVAKKVLQQHKWPGVLFLELNNVGSPKTGFTSSMVKNLIAAGWEIDSHTVSHPDLTKIGPAQLKEELELSRARIKRKYGQPADFFCYPAGRYDASVVAAVEAAGYKGATTTVDGIGEKDQPYELSRVRVNGDDGVEGFAAKLRQAEQ